MGSSLVKEKSKEKSDQTPLSFNAQALQIDEVMTTFVQDFLEHLDTAFPHSNVQKNSNVESNFKENSIQKSCNEDFFAGFATSEHLVKLLKDSSHEKFFRVHTDTDTKAYTNLQTVKFQILYRLFVEKSEGKGSQQGFFEYVDKFLSAETAVTVDNTQVRSQVALNTGLRFALSLLKEIQSVSPVVLENSLKHLYGALCDAPASSLYGVDVLAFQQDTALDEAREFLVSIVQAKASHTKTLVELSVKTIVRLGIVRSNPEDYLIAVNLLNQDSELATQVDLRNEIKALPQKGAQTSTSATEGKKSVSIKATRGIIQQSLFTILYNGITLSIEEDLESWTTDGHSLFAANPGIQKYSLPKDRNDTIFQQDKNEEMDSVFDKASYICFLNDKLYIRDANNTDQPLFVYDPQTLLLDKEATEAIKYPEESEEDQVKPTTMKVMSEPHKETGRKMGNGPIFTDGTYLYIVSQKKHIKPEDADEDAPSVPTALVIEQYCTKEWKHLKSVTLYKNEHSEIFSDKNQLDIDLFLKSATFHTNGSYLLLCFGKKRHLFDFETGIRIEKEKEDSFSPMVIHDWRNNNFYTFEKKEEVTYLVDFQIDALKIQKRLVASASGVFASPVEQIRDSYLKGYVAAPVKNVIQRKMIKNKVQSPAAPSEPQPSSSGAQVTALLLDYIQKSCQEFSLEYSKTESHSSDNYLKFFHWPSATYLTSSLFEALRDLLKTFKNLIDGKKSEDNLAQQTSLLNTIKILLANFKALNYCGVKLPEILDEDSYKSFVQEFQSSIIYIIENGYKKEGSDMAICGSLWEDLYCACQDIMSFSIQLVYSSAQEVVSNLAVQLSDPDLTDKKAENCAFSLQFLTSSANVAKIFDSSNEDSFKNLKLILSSLNRLQTSRLMTEVKTQKLYEDLPAQSQPTLFRQACDSFERNFFEQLLIQLEQLNLELEKKVDRTPAGKLKRKQQKDSLEKLTQIIASVFSQLSDRVSNCFDLVHEHIKTTVKSKDSEFFTEDRSKLYRLYCKRIVSILTHPEKTHLLNLYITTLSQVCGDQPQMCHSVTNSAIKLTQSITSMVSYLKTEHNKLKGTPEAEVDSDCEVTDADIKNDLTTHMKVMTRRVCWFLGSLSFSLIHIKSEELTAEQMKEEKADQKMARMLLESKVLSGGIENRFLSTFDQETKDKLKPVLQINQDTSILEMMGTSATNKEDQLLQDLLKKGSNDSVDLLVQVLQSCIEQPIMRINHAKVGQEDGLLMSRTAFTVMVKYSQLVDVFEETLQEIEVLDGQIDITMDAKERLKEFRAEIKDDDNFKQLLQQWVQASKIRIWIVEKKNNLSEKIEQSQRSAFVKTKKEKLKKEKEALAKAKDSAEKVAEESKPTEKAAEESKPTEAEEPSSDANPKVEVQIDTSSKPSEPAEDGKKESEDKSAEEEKPKEEDDDDDVKLTEDDKAEIQRNIFTQLEKELNEIYAKITAKADYLLKMQVPTAYRFKVNYDAEDTIMLQRMPSFLAESQEKASQSMKSEDWKETLKAWKSSSQKDQNEKRRQEMVESENTSVLACLLSPISVQKIQKRVETHFLKASRRAAGMLILSKVMSLTQSSEVQIDLSNWFTSALRDRTNKLTHYMDNIQSCGNHLEQLVRKNFFLILDSVLHNIKASRDKQTIIRLLDAMQWKFLGRDHSSIVESDVFKCLREGDGSLKHPISLCWGKRTGLKKWDLEEEPNNLQLVLLETFENLFLNIISRIVDSDQGTQMQLKKTGTAIPMLERSKSVIHTSISERLIGDAFHILFKELNRYVNSLKDFPGIDYPSFVNLYNKIAVKNLKDGENNKLGKDFEEELLFDIEKEHKQHDKDKEAKKKAVEDAKQKAEEGSEKKDEDLQATQDTTVADEAEQPKQEPKPEEPKQAEKATSEKKKETVAKETVKPTEVVETPESGEVTWSAYDCSECTFRNEEEPGPYCSICDAEAPESAKVKPQSKPLEDAVEKDGSNKDEEEDTEKTEAQQKETEATDLIKEKTNALEESQAKAIHKLYDGAYLRRLLRMLEIFTSVGQTQDHAKSMVQRVANPYMLQILANLFTHCEPRNQVLVLKVIQNLIRMGIPAEIFEDTILKVKSQTGRQAAFEIKSSVNFTSQFLGYWCGHLHLIREAMFTETKVTSTGSYEVSQEISKLVQTILMFHDSHYVDWSKQINATLKKACLEIESLNNTERDVVFCLISGADFNRISIGSLATTEANQLMTVLGYRQPPKEDEPKPTKLEPTFTNDKEMLVGFYFNNASREQQEIVEVQPHSVKPVLSFVKEVNMKLAEQSVLRHPEVLKDFVRLLVSDKSSAELQVQILKAISQLLTVLKTQFLTSLKENDLLSQLLGFLFKAKLAKQGTGKEKQSVIPVAWLEARIANMKVHALETCQSLEKSFLMKCQVLKQKQLVFTHVDQDSGSMIGQNAPLLSSINLHKVQDHTKYFVSLKTNETQPQNELCKQKLSFISSEKFLSLDSDVFRIMRSSEAVVTHDVAVRQLIVDISQKAKDYTEADDEGKVDKDDWSLVFHCVIFVVKKERFTEISLSQERSFFKHNKLEMPEKQSDAFEYFKEEMKVWAGIDISSLMYHICLLPDKSLAAIKGALPEILKKVEEETAEQKETLQRLETEGAATKLTLEKERQSTILDDRQKKVTEVLSLGTAFKDTDTESAVERLIKMAEKEEIATPTECEVYDLLSCKKADMENIDKLIETQFKEKVDISAEVKLKSEQAKCKLYLKEITGFNTEQLPKSYQDSFTQLLGEYASQTLLEILNSSDLKVLAPILLNNRAQRKQLSCFLKSSFNSAQLTFDSTGQKAELNLIKALMRKLFDFCLKEDSQCADYVHQFLHEDILLPGIATLKKLESEKSMAIGKFFDTEATAIEFLHPSLLRFAINICLEFRVTVVRESKTYLPTLMGLALGFYLKFWVPNDSSVPMKLLSTCQSIVFFTQEYLDELLVTDVVSKIINTPILTYVIKEIDYTVDSFSDVQKLLLEVYLSIITLKDMAEEKNAKIDSILQMTPGISLAKRCLRIVREKQDFQLLKYYVHLEALPAHVTKSMNQFFGCMHPHLDVKIRAKYSITDVERIQFKANEKCEFKPFTFVGISQTKDGKDMQLFTKETLKENEGIKKFNSSHFYVFYPVKKQVVISMGDNKRNRMTNQSSADIPQIIKSTQSLVPVKIATSRNSTFMLTESNELYSTGEKYGQSHEDFTLMKMPKSEVPDKIFCGRKCKFVIDKEGKTFYCGESCEFELPNNATSVAFKEFKLTTDESNTEKIVDISCGIWYNLYVTDKGKLWASGRKFLKRVGMDSEVAVNLPLPVTDEGPLHVMRAWSSQVKEEQMALVQCKTPSGEIQLWSVGKNEQGTLGLGGKIKETKVFTKLAYDSQAITFTDVSLFNDHAMAIDQNGLLWSWGNNQQGRAGLADDLDSMFQPTKVASFEALNLKAVKISAGKSHSLVLAKEQNGNIRLYSIGKDDSNFKNLGCTQQQATESVIRKIPHFSDLEIADFSASSQYSMIILKGDKLATDGLYEHKLSEEKTVNGIIHAYQRDNKWLFMSEDEYNATNKSDLPDVCLAFKCPIPNMDNLFNGAKPLISVDLQSLVSSDSQAEPVTSSISEVKIEDVVYTSYTKLGGDDLKVNLSEHEFLNVVSQHDLHPLVYFRLAKPLKQGVRLPVLDLKQIYGLTNKFGFDFEVTPDFSYVENKLLLDSSRDQFKEYCDLLNKFPEKGDQELFKQMDKQMTELTGEIELKHVEKFNVKDMTFKEEKDDGKLAKVSNQVKEKRINLIWHYNYFFVKLQRFLVSKAQKGFKGQKIANTSAANIFNSVKHLILTSVKMNFVDTSISSLSTGSQGSVSINRNDAIRFEETGKVDNTGEYTVFGQIFTQLKGNYDVWKQNGPDDQALSIDFSGEASIDAGGPYRETLTNFVMELESGVLPLIKKTTNNKTNHGNNRDCYIINEESVTPTHQQLFKFLGVLIGYAFRSKSCLPFNLAPVFWKQLVGDKLEENDLNSIDTYTHQMFQSLRKNAKLIKSESEFEMIVDQCFVISVNGKEVPLCEGGQERMVNQSNIEEFISLMCERRFSESLLQIKWIKEGMNIIIPQNIVGIVQWSDVEDRVSGQKIVDVDKLKTITEYRNCSADTKVIKMFWNIMARIADEDKTAYLKFVWGRARMPFDCSKLRYKHRVALIEYWDKECLPEAHTCFFALDVPNYESEEIFEKKLLISIRFCGEIDND